MTREDLSDTSPETMSEIYTIARLARLHDDIEDFEEGYQTMLGERGVNLSGGQRQRLAIARAITADPRVLILDDCLSAVDARTEEEILANLKQVLGNRSGIIVSHRVRAVQECDHIIVLEDGRVTAEGTHDKLIEGDGYYAKIAAQQMNERGGET
jgi:ATP-binding cassette subfamily B protein